MSTTTIALVIGGAAVVGVGAYVYFAGKAEREVTAANAAAAAAAKASAGATTRKKSVGDALAQIGGRLLAEGAKYALNGAAGYIAGQNQKAQKAA